MLETSFVKELKSGCEFHASDILHSELELNGMGGVHPMCRLGTSPVKKKNGPI
jgi:hypothetical protein